MEASTVAESQLFIVWDTMYVLLPDNNHKILVPQYPKHDLVDF
jgi:hypothetical protein